MKTAPANLDAERALLSSIFVDPVSVYQVTDLVDIGSFYHQPNAWIFDAQLALGESADAVTVAQVLQKRGLMNDDALNAYIRELMQPPDYANARHYASTVREYAIRRAVIDAAAIAAQAAYDETKEIDAVLSQSRQALMKAEQGAAMSATGDLETGADEFERDFIERQSGTSQTVITTGVRRLDELMGGGCERSEYVIIGGGPGSGKTALAMQMAYVNARQGRVVNYHSFEVSRDSLRRRLISMYTSERGIKFRESREPGIPFGMMKRGGLKGAEIDAVIEANQAVKQLPLRIFEASDGRTVATVKAKAMATKNALGKLDMVIVDQLQHMNSTSERANDRERVSSVSRDLLALTIDKDLGQTLVVGLSRLSRGGYETPKIGDLKESGDIESDAHVIALLQRTETGLNIIAAKNRDWGMFQEEFIYHKEVNRIV